MTAAIYLDHNASVPLRPEAAAAVVRALGRVGNPSSVHGHGRALQAALAQARARVARAIGAAPEAIVFTSGATEANALALRGAARRAIVSAVEHPSALTARDDAIRLPVDARGVVDLDALDRLLADGAPSLVSIMLANNETGVIQPVAEAARLAHARGAWLHCDATQAAGASRSTRPRWAPTL